MTKKDQKKTDYKPYIPKQPPLQQHPIQGYNSGYYVGGYSAGYNGGYGSTVYDGLQYGTNGSGQYNRDHSRHGREASSSSIVSYEQQGILNNNLVSPNLNKPLPSIKNQQLNSKQQQPLPVTQQQPSPYHYSQQYNYFQNGTNETNEPLQYFDNSNEIVDPAIIMDGPTHNVSTTTTTTTTLQQIKTSTVNTVNPYDVISNVNNDENIVKSNRKDSEMTSASTYTRHPLQFIPPSDSGSDSFVEGTIESTHNNTIGIASQYDSPTIATANDVKMAYYQRSMPSYSSLPQVPDEEKNVISLPRTAPFNVQLRETIIGEDPISIVEKNDDIVGGESSNNSKANIDPTEVNTEANTEVIDDIPEDTGNDENKSFKYLSPIITQGFNDIKISMSDNVSLNSSSDNESPTKITATTIAATTSTTSPSQDKPVQISFSKDSGYQSPGINDKLSTKNSINSFDDSNNAQGVKSKISPIHSNRSQSPPQNSLQHQPIYEESTPFYNTRNIEYAISNPITTPTTDTSTNANSVGNDLSHTPPDLPANFFLHSNYNHTYPKSDSGSEVSVPSYDKNKANQIPRKESPHPGIPIKPMFNNYDFSTVGGTHSHQNSVNRISLNTFINDNGKTNPFTNEVSADRPLYNREDTRKFSPYYDDAKTNSFTNNATGYNSGFNYNNDDRRSNNNSSHFSTPSIETRSYSHFSSPSQFSNNSNDFSSVKSQNLKQQRYSMPLHPKADILNSQTKRFSMNHIFKKTKHDNPTYMQAKKELDKMRYHEAIRLFSEVIKIFPNSYSVRCDRAYAAYQLEDWTRAKNDLTIAINRKPKKSKAYSLRGEVFRLLGDSDRALSDLNKSIKIQKNTFALRSRAEVYSSLRKFADSLADLDAALEMEPKNGFTLIRRAKVYCSLREYNEAINDLTRALSIDPSNAHIILANRGEIYRLTNKLDDALKDLNMSLARDENSMTLERRGAVLKTMGRDHDALADFERIIQLNPRSFFAHKNRADILLSLGYKDEALVNLNVALQLEPNNFTLIKYRADISHSLGFYDDALIDYDAGLRIQPNDAEMLKNRGEIHRIKQNFSKAIKDFTRCLEIEPYNVFALTRRGEVYRMLKKGPKALVDLDEAIRIEPDNVMARESRGAVNRTFRRYEEALRDLDEAIYLSPDSVFALTNRGAVYNMLKRYNESLTDLNMALSLDPNHTFALETRGALLNTLKRYDDALVDLNLAIELEPTNVWALTYRGDVLAALGHNEESLNDLNSVLLELPDWGYPLALRGAVYCSMRSHTKALLDLDRALQNIRDKAFNIDYETKALCQRGAVYHTLGRHDEALFDLEKVLLREPNNIFALTERGSIYYSMGKIEDALRDYEIILRVEPDNTNALAQKRRIEEMQQ